MPLTQVNGGKLITVEANKTAEETAPPDDRSAPTAQCRLCGQVLGHGFVDLGMSPPCESYLTVEQLNQMVYAMGLS